MYLDKENLSKIRRFCQTNALEFNHLCQNMREIVENSNTRGKLYRTFWINKLDPKVRVFSLEETKDWQKTRQIDYPRPNVKCDCAKINDSLQKMLRNVPWLHGFVKNRNIYTNAMAHAQINPIHVINIDMEDAFHQVKFKNLCDIGEVVFGFTKKVSRKFAKMLSFKGQMVQGNPASPMILNLIGLTVDVRLYALAKSQGLRYTRYADDLTLSSAKHFSFTFIKFVNSIVTQQHFKVNAKKTKCYKNVMEITGIKIYHNRGCITKRRNFKKDDKGNFTINKKYKKFLRQLEYLKKQKGVTHWHVPEDYQERYKELINSVYEGNHTKFLNEHYASIDGIIGGIKAWLYTNWKKIEYNWISDYKPCNAKMKGWKSNHKFINKKYQMSNLKARFQSDELYLLQEYRRNNPSEQSETDKTTF